MAVRFILMMALVVVASAVRIPDPNIIIGVKQDVIAGAGCGGGCCDDDLCDKKICWFDGREYKSGSVLNEACIRLVCLKGQWKYIQDQFNTDCGECKVDGDPHIWSFDKSIKDGRQVNSYKLNQDGVYAIAQLYYLPIPYFGIKGEFEPCNGFGAGNPCISSITYIEPGIEIRVDITNPGFVCYVNGGPSDNCGMTVTQVKEVPSGNKVVHNSGITIPGGVECANIVGTEGLSMSLCTVSGNYPFLNIRAMPALSSYLYGLCNTYTGLNVHDFVLRDDSSGTDKVSANKCLKGASAPYTICDDPFVDSWRWP